MPSNIRWFIAFRVLFNSRFYYPVLGVLFLDLGLSASQYALLNVIWAVTIVLCEVPSGAVADLLGRRRLVVFAAAIMVLEMTVFAFAPTGVPWLLFALMALNRVLSGLAEASASGADEALAYDSIPPDQREDLWPRVLRRLGAWQSAGFLAAMIVGGLVYDSSTWTAIHNITGFQLPPEIRIRAPIYLTLGMSIMAFFAARQLKEDRKPAEASVGATYREVLLAGGWILGTTPVLLVILAGLLNDSAIRLFLTFNSNYYRLLQIPEAWFGVLGAMFAAFGFVVPSLAAWMVHRFNPVWNFVILSSVTMSGLLGLAFAHDWSGIAFAALLGCAMFILTFLVSTYLNRWVGSERRATVLSFRGLAFNVAYAAAGIGFACVLASIKSEQSGNSEEVIFGEGLSVLPVWFAVGCLCLLGIAVYRTASRASN